MAGDNTVYDYATIEACNQMITQKVGQMEQTAETFKQQVSQLVRDTWGGTAASEYEGKAGQIQTDLQAGRENLTNIGKSLATGAEDMGQTDKKGGQRISAV